MIPMDSGGVSLVDVLGEDALIVRALFLNGALSVTTSAPPPTTATSTPPRCRLRTGITNARSLARCTQGLVGAVDGGPSEPLLTRASRSTGPAASRRRGPTRCCRSPGLAVESTIALGFWSASPFAPIGGAAHVRPLGAGGSVGFADPDHRIAGGYVMSKMGVGISGGSPLERPHPRQLRRRRRRHRPRLTRVSGAGSWGCASRRTPWGLPWRRRWRRPPGRTRTRGRAPPARSCRRSRAACAGWPRPRAGRCR